MIAWDNTQPKTIIATWLPGYSKVCAAKTCIVPKPGVESKKMVMLSNKRFVSFLARLFQSPTTSAKSSTPRSCRWSSRRRRQHRGIASIAAVEVDVPPATETVNESITTKGWKGKCEIQTSTCFNSFTSTWFQNASTWFFKFNNFHGLGFTV